MKTKHTLLAAAIMAATTHTTHAQTQTPPAITPDPAIEAQIEAKLATMTLDEKVGQMLELTIDCVTDHTITDHFAMSEQALTTVFNKYKTGSILNVPKGIAQTPQVWATTIRQLNQHSMEQCNGIPQIIGVDQNHGATYTWGATFFPQEINMAASFNTDIPYRIGQITAYESRACLIPWVYNPVMDLGRNPLWSRLWESFGEDTHLNAKMAVAFTQGYQGNDPNHIDNQHVAVSIKHYMAYGNPASGKDRTPAYIPERELRERYFEPFKQCIQAGALTVMVNSSIINGIPTHANHTLLTKWLKEDLNWDGMIVTDWADIDNLYKRDHVAANKKEAIALAINAGIDMTMDPYDTTFCDLLKQLVQEGTVPLTRIDDAVRRILRLKHRVGLFNTKTWDIPYNKLAKQYPKFASQDYATQATQMAEETIVLLKNNNNILPLKQGTKILCIGPNADSYRAMNGGWSYTWQGDKADQACQEIGKYHTFQQAIKNKFGTQNVTYNNALTYATQPQASWEQHNGQLDQQTLSSIDADTQKADVILAFVGENSYCETPGNTNDLNLHPQQKQLIQHLAKTGKPIILILNQGRPRLITDIEPHTTAIIHTFLPSNYGSDALANLIAGDANFSAKLPYTYPKHTGSIATYDYKPCQQRETMQGNYNYEASVDELYPFGYGLSYTTYQYNNLKVNKTTFTPTDTLTFTIDVTNTGTRTGKEPILLYTSDHVATITPDNKRLRAFTKIQLQPQQTKTVTLTIPATDLAFVGIDNNWIIEKGDFTARIANQTINLHCTQTKHLGPNK